MPDLRSRIRSHYEHIAPPVDVEGLADRMEARSFAARPWAMRRAVAIAMIAAVATALAIGLPLWLLGLGDATPVAPTMGPHPTSTLAPPTTESSTSTSEAISDGPSPTTTIAELSAWTSFGTAEGVPAGSIGQLLVAVDGSVWVIGDGIGRLTAGGWERVDVPDGFVFDGFFPAGRRTAVKAAAAPDGAVWFSHAGGVHRYRDGAWTAYPNPSDPACEPSCQPTTIAVTGDGSVWTAAADHVYVWLDDSWQFVAEDFTVTNDRAVALGGVNELVAGPDGRLWYSTFDEVVRYDGAAAIIAGYDAEGWLWNQVLAGDRSGGAWVLVGYSDPDRYLMHVSDMAGGPADWPTYPLGDASAVATAPNDDVWVAVSSEPIDVWDGGFGPVEPVSEPGAYRFDGSVWTRFTVADGLASDDVRAVAVTPDGTVWFGTTDGVSRFDPTGADPGGRIVDLLTASP